MHKICTHQISPWPLYRDQRSNGVMCHVTCVGTPSGHPDQDKSRSVNVYSSGGQSTAGLTMLTTHIYLHTPTYRAYFIVPSQTRSAGILGWFWRKQGWQNCPFSKMKERTINLTVGMDLLTLNSYKRHKVQIWPRKAYIINHQILAKLLIPDPPSNLQMKIVFG